MTTPPTSVLCIPGRWATRDDIVKTMAALGGGLMLVGNMIFDPANKQYFAMEVAKGDPAIAQAFTTAGQRRLPQDTLDEMAHHTFALYISTPGGSLETARHLMEIGCRVGDAGGLAVKAESSGTQSHFILAPAGD